MATPNTHIIHFQYNNSEALTIQAERQNFTIAETWLDEICNSLGIDNILCAHLQIVLDEMFANACMHAYAADAVDKPMTLSVSFDTEQKILELVFINKGSQFNPLQHLADPHKQVAEHRKGGLGIYMLRQLADSLSYEWRDDCNILTFRKNVC